MVYLYVLYMYLVEPVDIDCEVVEGVLRIIWPRDDNGILRAPQDEGRQSDSRWHHQQQQQGLRQHGHLQNTNKTQDMSKNLPIKITNHTNADQINFILENGKW